MNKWVRLSTTVMLTFMLALPVTERAVKANSGAGSEDLTEKKAHEMAELLIDSYGVTGVQYAIRDDGEVVLSGGLGIDEKGSKGPVSPVSMFGIGSVSKMYVTAATMLLSDAGKVDIDQPLTNYIKDFKMDDERYKLITPRMLMNHSAGLYGTHYKNSMLLDDNDTENHDTLLKNLHSERLKSDPGEYSVYANDGFQLLEILVERVSGLSYSEFIAENFSEPLGLTLTKTPLDSFDRKQLYPTRIPEFGDILPTENANVIGTGGLYSTAEELTLFSEVLIGNKTDLLSKASVKAMQQPEYSKGVWVSSESNIFNYGLGWDAVDLAPFDEYGIKAVTKGGDTILYHSALIAIPEKGISIALLSSGGSSIFNTAAASTILLEYLKEQGDITQINPDKTFGAPVKKEMPERINAYAGLYGTVGGTLPITISEGEVELPALMDGLIPAQTYIYTGDNAFTGLDGTVISFDEESNGHTYLSVTSYLTLPGIGQFIMAYYELQKLNDNPLDDAVIDAWKERNGRIYYAVDEKINSLFYLSPAIVTKQIVFDEQHGYANGTKITAKDESINVVEIPVMNGRDAFDLKFTQDNGVEYLQSGGWTFIEEAAVKPIYAGPSSIVTIPSSGHARWFKIGEGAKNRQMTVELPKLGGFAVYDANGFPVNLSTATGSNTVVLPENGIIVFGGQAGEVFNIKLEQQ